MRKIHRLIALLFGPFLAMSAITGLLWAYAPYLYLKSGTPSKSSVVIDDTKTYLPMAEVIRAAQSKAEGARVTSIFLKAESDRLIYKIYLSSKSGQKEIWVDAANGEVTVPPRDAAYQFHSWVMKLHQLQFFGTKKELTAFPGAGLLLMLSTGIFLFKRGLK